jgi:hypothetical protein
MRDGCCGGNGCHTGSNGPISWLESRHDRFGHKDGFWLDVYRFDVSGLDVSRLDMSRFDMNGLDNWFNVNWFGFNMDWFNMDWLNNRLEHRFWRELKRWNGRDFWHNRSNLERGGCEFAHVWHRNLRLEDRFWNGLGQNGFGNRLENRFSDWLENRLENRLNNGLVMNGFSHNGGFLVVEGIQVQIKDRIVKLIVGGNRSTSRKRFGLKRRHRR